MRVLKHDGPYMPDDWDMAKYRTAEKRVRKMTEREMLDWTDVAGNGMSKGLMDYRKESDIVSLREIQDALIQLWALTAELVLRNLAQDDPVKHPL